MNIKTYQEESQRTFSYRNEPISQEQTDLLHCAIGASTETNELLDAFKKHIYYGKPLDVVNVGEEIADTMWYISNLCRLLNLDLEVLLQNNINKLKVRYPEKFTNELAENRNLEAERKVLEVNGGKNVYLTNPKISYSDRVEVVHNPSMSVVENIYPVNEQEKPTSTLLSSEELMQYIQRFADKHGIEFVKEGEVGFGRVCIGLKKNGNYIEFNPRLEYSPAYITEFYNEKFYHIAPSKAYTKFDCFAVLGTDEESLQQLYRWILSLEEMKATLCDYVRSRQTSNNVQIETRYVFTSKQQ